MVRLPYFWGDPLCPPPTPLPSSGTPRWSSTHLWSLGHPTACGISAGKRGTREIREEVVCEVLGAYPLGPAARSGSWVRLQPRVLCNASPSCPDTAPRCWMGNRNWGGRMGTAGWAHMAPYGPVAHAGVHADTRTPKHVCAPPAHLHTPPYRPLCTHVHPLHTCTHPTQSGTPPTHTPHTPHTLKTQHPATQ